MTDNQGGVNFGEQMKGAVTEALQSGDFSHLNDLVFSAAESTLKEAAKKVTEKGAEFKSATNISNAQTDTRAGTQANTQGTRSGAQYSAQAGASVNTRSGSPADNQSQAGTGTPVWQQRVWQREQEKSAQLQQDWQRRMQEQQRKQRRIPAKIIDLIKFKKVGSVSGVLYQVFGWLGISLTAFMALGGIFVEYSTVGWGAVLLFGILFVLMIRGGLIRSGRLKRAERYAELCGNKMYGDVEAIASSTGQSRRSVLKDIRKMLRLGIFPEGHLDEQGKWFMLNHVIYKQYQDMETSRRQREEEERLRLEQKEEPKSLGEMVADAKREQETELNAMVAEGMEYIRKLRDLNDMIVGEVISAKLYRLERLLNEIFDNVREHPEQMHRMHKLMDYYLPTTLKLVEAYEEFDSVSAPREDILSAKAEIEKTLDIINQAFTELLNNLFQDAVMDVTTDAQVLQTMLAQEGLTREMEFAEISGK